MAVKNEERTAADMLKAILQHRRLFLISAAVFAALAMVAAHYIPLKYTGTAMFERRSDAATENISRNDSESFQVMKLTLQHELCDAGAIGRAVDEAGLTQGFERGADGKLTDQGSRARSNLISDIKRGVAVKWKVRSDQVDLIAVCVTHTDPTVARDVANVLVKNYINSVSERILNRLEDSVAFLVEKVGQCQSSLLEVNRQKLEFEAAHAGMFLNHPEALQERIQRLNSDIDTLRCQQNMSKQKLARIQSLIQSMRLRKLSKELSDTREKLNTMVVVKHMTPIHPKVGTYKARIAQLQRQIEECSKGDAMATVLSDENIDVGLTMQLAAAQSEYEVVAGEMERMHRRLGSYQDILANSGTTRQNHMQIERVLEEQTAEANRWQKRLMDVQITLSAEKAKRRTHLSAVQLAQKPGKPFFPPLTTVICFALGGGVAFGYAVVFLYSAMNRSVTSAEDAGKFFGVPVHGVVSKIMTAEQSISRKLWRHACTGAISFVVVSALGISAMSIVLRLRYPEYYKQWCRSPQRFVCQQAAKLSNFGETPEIRRSDEITDESMHAGSNKNDLKSI